jgi:uroporphyrinogen-III synthase
MPGDLAGLRVMVTRPEEQAGPLLDKLHAAGASAFSYPLIRIVSLSAPDLPDLADYDLAIFISPTAVRVALTGRDTASLPASLKLATVGKGTARELEDRLGRPPEICPARQFDSEGLLDEPALQAVSGWRILIIRGRGGRELLAERLRQRGAQVDYAEVYERCMPDADTGPLETALQHGRIDVIVITSREALDNLMRLLPNKLYTPLRQIPVLVIHPRQAEAVRQYGFVHPPILAHEGNDAAIIETLTAWKNRHD